MRVQRSEAGFSIVEVVVAMTIFSVGILSIFQVTDSSFKVATGTTHRARATAIATKVVEEARAMPFSNLTVGTSAPTTETVGGSTFTVTRDVTSHTQAGATNAYKQVRVLVEWVDGSGGHDVSQTSFVYPAGPSVTTPVIGSGALPLAATLHTLTNLGASVKLGWTPPATGGKVERFVVQRTLKKASNHWATGPVWTVTGNEPPTSTSFLVNGLAASTAYVFRVGSVASNGSVVWSGDLEATTAASASVDCKVASATVTPETVQRVSPFPSPLAVTPTITVETSGTCTGFNATYEGPDGSEIDVPLVPSGLAGNVWTAQITNSGSTTWQVGSYSVEITDTMSNQRGAASFTVCDAGPACT